MSRENHSRRIYVRSTLPHLKQKIEVRRCGAGMRKYFVKFRNEYKVTLPERFKTDLVATSSGKAMMTAAALQIVV